MRNYGVTSRSALGAATTDRLSLRAVTQRDSIRLPARFPPDALVNCDGLDRHSFLQYQDHELGAKCFFFGALTLIGLVLFVSWFVISNFVA